MMNLSPPLKGPRSRLPCKTSQREVCRESGTNLQYQTPYAPLVAPCSWRSHTFVRAKKRWLPNAYNEVPHANASSFVAVVRSCHATVSLQRGREGVAWRDKTMASKETTACVNQCSLGTINHCVRLLQINWKFSPSPPPSPSLSHPWYITRY